MIQLNKDTYKFDYKSEWLLIAYLMIVIFNTITLILTTQTSIIDYTIQIIVILSLAYFITKIHDICLIKSKTYSKYGLNTLWIVPFHEINIIKNNTSYKLLIPINEYLDYNNLDYKGFNIIPKNISDYTEETISEYDFIKTLKKADEDIEFTKLISKYYILKESEAFKELGIKQKEDEYVKMENEIQSKFITYLPQLYIKDKYYSIEKLISFNEKYPNLTITRIRENLSSNLVTIEKYKEWENDTFK